MGTAIGFIFFGVEFVFIILCLLAIVRTGFVRLESSIGLRRDGLPYGKTAPGWSLPDVEGRLRVTPAGDHWQLLIFADHSLASFPDLVAEINELFATNQELEVIVLSHDDQELCEATVRVLDLRVPLVRVNQAFYERYRVRVMPFAFILDPLGKVQWVGLANAYHLPYTWRLILAIHRESL